MKNTNPPNQTKQYISLLYLLAFLCLPPPLPCLADEADQAKATFNKGTQAVANEDYSLALEHFRKSYSLRPKAIVLYNIAMCQKALSKYAEAITSFKQYLKDTDVSPDPDSILHQKAGAAIEELENYIGKLKIEGAPQGADVLVDEEIIPQTSLEQPLSMNPGEYMVQVVAQGYEPFSKRVTIEAGKQIGIEAKLAPLATRIDESTTVNTVLETVEPPEVILPPELIEPVEPKTNTEQNISPLFIGGATAVALGTCAAIIGLTFNIKGQRHAEDAKKFQERWDTNGNSADWDKYYEIKRDKLSTDTKGMIAGYSVAAALITAGTVFLVFDNFKKEENSSIAVKATPFGVFASF